ncbi:MAG: tRNA lysidine(34) synthetase TilS [Clostridia bacterium]|nr:tRNA lysidine(34) synthetase TilS [Clostridia bacterium]
MLTEYDFLTAYDRLVHSWDYEWVLSEVRRALDGFSMWDMLRRGAVIGLSGGKDSLLLLICLNELSKSLCFPLRAVHINHMIRGEDADADEALSRFVAEALGVPFSSFKIDIPAYAKAQKKSTELCAREVRYKQFSRVMREYSLGCVAVAHNATDNLETMLFNIARGTGTAGASGIPPKRDCIIRPLIYLSAEKITSLLDKFGIKYAVDRTNFECDYSRNAIRNRVLPTLREINPALEVCAMRTSENLRRDSDALDRIAEGIFAENYSDGYLKRSALDDCHGAIKFRLIKRLCEGVTDIEHTHIDAISKRLEAGGSFVISLPSGYEFYSDAYKCTVREKSADISPLPKPRELSFGANILDEYRCVIYLSDAPWEVNLSNIYNFVVSLQIPRDIIVGKLYVRARKEGDAYCFGGISHKVKKMMIDAKIPKERRDSYPILCDGDGILYLPRFSYRNSREIRADDECIYVTLALLD